MATYLLAFHGGSMAEGAEEQARVMAAWGRWYEELGGALIDGGNPVGRWATLEGDSALHHGGSNPVTGYTILAAESLDEAIDLARGCPQLEAGSIEVCELLAMEPAGAVSGADGVEAMTGDVEAQEMAGVR
jgi:hypothetical protein